MRPALPRAPRSVRPHPRLLAVVASLSLVGSGLVAAPAAAASVPASFAAAAPASIGTAPARLASAAIPVPTAVASRTCKSAPFVTKKPKPFYRIPALLRNAAGQLLAFAEKRDNQSVKDTGDFDIALRISNDGGCTWGRERIITNHGRHRVSNPVPILDAQTGQVILLTTIKLPDKLHLFIQRSNDGGANWSAPAEIVRAKAGLPDDAYPDNTLVAPDGAWKGGLTQPGHGLQLSTGPHQGRLLFSMGYAKNGWNGGYGIYSDDHGRTWRIGFDLRSPKKDNPLIEGGLAETPDGRVLITYRTKKYAKPGKTQFYSISSDGGRTAPAFRKLGVRTTAVHGSVLNAGGFLLFAAPSTITKDSTIRRGLQLWRSTDNGRTWKAWGKLTAPSFNAAYSDMVLVAPGQLAIIYEGGKKTWKERVYVQRIPLSNPPRPR